LHNRDENIWRVRIYDSLDDVFQFSEIGSLLALSDINKYLENTKRAAVAAKVGG
jgi:hypothetical protein